MIPDKNTQKNTLLNWLKENYSLVLYTVGTVSLTFYQVYLLIHKSHMYGLKNISDGLFYLIGLNLWLLILGLIDIKKRIIPLCLTAPIILGVFVYRFFETISIGSKTPQLIGLGIGSFYSATGICLGFAIFDGVTHFGNWMTKCIPSTQGLIAIWNALPFMIIGTFITPYTFWIIPICIVISRIIFELAYSRIKLVSIVLDKLYKIPWFTYLILICFIFIGFYFSLQDMFKSDTGKSILSKPEIIVYSLSISYVLEELIVPFVYYLVSLYKKETLEKVQESEIITVMGGGDALLAASIGAILGPFMFLNCVQIAFFLVFIFILCFRLIDYFKEKLKSTDKRKDKNKVKEIPLAPFIAFSLQIVVIYSMLT